MDFFIWNKQDSLMGVSANVLLDSRPDLIYDDVIVIHEEGDIENIVMIETANHLRETYDIESTDVNEIGFVVSMILTQENVEMMDKAIKKLKEEVQENVIDPYAKMVEDIIKEIYGQNAVPEPPKEVPLNGSYKDPECTVIDLSDVDNEVKEKKLTVVLHHVFAADEVEELTELKCLEDVAEELDELARDMEKYANECDVQKIDELLGLYEKVKRPISDPCDATIKLEVNAIYQYDTNTIIECKNGQNIIIDNTVMLSLKNNALEYEKHTGPSNDKYRVHYKTVDIYLDEYNNELKERNDTVFIVSV